MHAFTKCLIAGAIASAPAIVASSSAHAQAGYTLTLLDDGGNANIVATGINDDGEIVGRLNTGAPSGSGPFWASSVAVPGAISQPTGALWWQALKINASGDFLGSAGFGGAAQPFAWSGGTPVAIAFGGADTCFVPAINDSFAFAGSCTTAGVRNATVWNANVPSALANPTGGDDCFATSINANGVVGGSCSFTANDYVRPVIWSGGTATVLAMPKKVTEASVLDINAAGTAVGEVRTPASNGWKTEAGIWTNRANKLVSPSGAFWTRAIAINDSGDVLGQVFYSNGALGPVVWIGGTNTGLVELPKNGFEQCEAFDINNDGSVVGFCYDMADPTDYPVIWTL